MAKYMSGSIVLTKYFNFDKEEVNGVFCVLNDEALDSHTHHNGNVLVVKVTSQLKSVEAYSVFLNSSKNSFLLKDSFAQCNKIHTLNKKSIIELIGVLDADTTNNILDKTILLLQESKRKKKGGSYEPLYKKSSRTPRLSSRLYGSRVHSRQSSRKF